MKRTTELMEYALRRPFAFRPKYGENRRSIAQDGRYTVHGVSTEPLENQLGDQRDFAELTLAKIPIEYDFIDSILLELDRVGIHVRRVFPDEC